MSSGVSTPYRRGRRQRQARRWRRGFAVAIALSLVTLLANLALGELRPGNRWSLGYGIAATVLLLVAVAYSARRRAPRIASRLRLGGAATWLRVHVYGSLLFLLLMVMHSGFGLPTGRLNGWIWALSVWTVATGLGGLALQRWIPRVLASGLTVEVLYDRIPELVDDLRQRAETLVSAGGEALRSLYTRDVAPVLAAPSRRLIYCVDVTGGVGNRLSSFTYLRRFLPADEEARLDQLERLYRTKLEIDAHYTLQQLLRAWLYLHVPPSLALVALVALHIVSVVTY